ncbi:MAG TPA: hypothetical protein VIV12_24880 [Streptosporangiaceae bacterium]
MNVAALIIGIDGWERYTLPLVESLRQHEPACRVVVVDNASAVPYPWGVRTERLCYAAAINRAAEQASDADWYVVLSNDVLCTGPFAGRLAGCARAIVGPCLKRVYDAIPYLEGWCVAAPRAVWQATGGWDARYVVSSWEDIDFTTAALAAGFDLVHDPEFPFQHFDQRQRFGLPEFAGTHERNRVAFGAKWGLW